MESRENGGEQTLDSYGVNDPSSLPAPHLEWIKALPLRFGDQKRLFVHAGIRPGVAIADQSDDDLLWIREPFLSFKGSYNTFVVHGHTPTKSRLPDLCCNRLNIDTGAKDASRRSNVVLDPFCGSGSTLIATEKTGRHGYRPSATCGRRQVRSAATSNPRHLPALRIRFRSLRAKTHQRRSCS